MNSPCRHLEWDSQFFGFRIARVNDDHLTADSVRAILSWCEREQIDCLYFLSTIDDDTTIQLAEANGFHLVDVRVTLDRTLTDADALPSSETPAIRRSRHEDIPTLQAIARVSYEQSRFHADPRFPKVRSAELYAVWIEKSCLDPNETVYVAVVDGVPAGYLSSYHNAAGCGQIGLVAVAGPMQGRGLGRQLMRAALRDWRQQGLTCAEVVTQGRNVRAQRLFQRSGFMTRTVQVWYHRWFTATTGSNITPT